MRRTIIGISTSFSHTSCSRGSKHPWRESSIWHITSGGSLPIVGIRSSTKAGTVPPISSAVPAHSVNNAAGYASEWKPSDRKRRPLFREINWITPAKRAKQGNSGSSSCTRVPCKQEARRIAFRATKSTVPRADVFSPTFWMSPPCARARPNDRVSEREWTNSFRYHRQRRPARARDLEGRDSSVFAEREGELAKIKSNKMKSTENEGARNPAGSSFSFAWWVALNGLIRS